MNPKENLNDQQGRCDRVRMKNHTTAGRMVAIAARLW
jgi:hypothetical protein